MAKVNCMTWRSPSFWNTSGFLDIFRDAPYTHNLFDETKSRVTCNYAGIEPNGLNDIKLSLSDRGPLPAKPKTDFVLVTCSNENETLYRDIKYRLRSKSEAETSEAKNSNTKETDEQLNFILFGLDSVSSLVAERKLPLTLQYFRETLHSYHFKGYTKVGDNTAPNILAALNGQTILESLIPTFDFPPFFRLLKDLGYVTCYGEDWIPYIPPLPFKYPDYTHNLRQFFLAGDKYQPLRKGHSNKKDPKCFANEFKHDIVIKFAESFIREYENRLKLTFTWINEIGHHQSNFLEAADETIKTFFEKLHNEGKLNKTVVVFFSDHGPRYGKALEKDLVRFTGRLPMIHIVLPTEIRNKYPHIDRNMKTNTERLTAPFDLFETLKDIVLQRFKEIPEVNYPFPRGISLLREIPKSRSCYDAGIPENYCPCYSFADMPSNDPSSTEAAEFMVSQINNFVSSYKNVCSTIVLDKVKSAKMQNNHERSKVFRRLVVVFSVSPGNGVYEGTVQFPLADTKQMTLLGDINRLTAYADSASCMQNADLKLYCHCS